MIAPEPKMTKKEYESLPVDERPTHFACQKHGEFPVKYERILDKLGVLMATCPECSSEYNDWSQEQERIANEEREKEWQLSFFNNRLKRAGVSERHFDKTFDSYISDTKEKQYALESMRYFADKVLEGVCKNMILCGSVGTGKTHLCQATIRYLLEHNRELPVKMITITRLIRYYRSSWQKENDYTEQDVINELSQLDLLIIDEMGVQNGTDNELNIIFEIINNRYENKLPTVIISNLEKGELVGLLGTRIIDRLKEDGCRVLGMSWDSHRETNKDSF